MEGEETVALALDLLLESGMTPFSENVFQLCKAPKSIPEVRVSLRRIILYGFFSSKKWPLFRSTSSAILSTFSAIGALAASRNPIVSSGIAPDFALLASSPDSMMLATKTETSATTRPRGVLLKLPEGQYRGW